MYENLPFRDLPRESRQYMQAFLARNLLASHGHGVHSIPTELAYRDMRVKIWWLGIGATLLSLLLLAGLTGCGSSENVRAGNVQGQETAATTVGVTSITRKPIFRQLTLSSELVPFQEIDVFAKEAGYVKAPILVDYGSRVKAGQLMATLEIPELEAQIQQDAAAVKSAGDQVMRAQNEITSLESVQKVYHLAYTRLKGVSDSRPGLVAQQELDAAQGKDLEYESQIEVAKASMAAAQGQLDAAKAKQQHDQVLFDYSRITAPFDGVVTQRYANVGTLMQAGTSSATNVLPLVRLSEDDLFRLVIPVPESYVKYIRIGDPVEVRVPSLDKVFPGKVTRFSTDVAMETRTMHTEVDVSNPSHVLIPGVYAEATLDLERKNDALVVPLQAVNQNGSGTTVYLVDTSNHLAERQVRLGLQTPSEAEVLEGLNDGEKVVVSDRSGLKTGMLVKPQIVEQVQMPADNQ
jgi:RND family efflux transporter MFP subunit